MMRQTDEFGVKRIDVKNFEDYRDRHSRKTTGTTLAEKWETCRIESSRIEVRWSGFVITKDQIPPGLSRPLQRQPGIAQHRVDAVTQVTGDPGTESDGRPFVTQ